MKRFTFYKLYADILDAMNDTDAGKFAMRICEYEFEDKLPGAELSGKERFFWSNISDMLTEVKEAERGGKSLKKYNLRSEHFTFYETYFEAMKLLNGNNLGAFVKAICGYMFRGEEAQFKDKEVQGYFNLCKRKMDISRKRKSGGSRGGKAKHGADKTQESAEKETGEQSKPRKEMTYEQFRSAQNGKQNNRGGGTF